MKIFYLKDSFNYVFTIAKRNIILVSKLHNFLIMRFVNTLTLDNLI